MAACPVSVGNVIAGKYLVESIIGEGGMGVVVAARHLELEQRVAIKFLLPAIAEQELAAQRFRREARAAARIRGEHVCRVLDVGSLEAGVPFMVMEYLEGCDLAAELTRRKRLPIEEIVDYVLQACEALAEAHAAGIVHRDLKPGNLFLSNSADGSRRIKVLDFGVSKFLVESGSGSPALTKTSSLVGSPIYMAPEQFDGSKRVDERTDIWALGIVLYELATGITPFESETIAQLISSVLHAKPMSFAEHGLIVPDGFEAIVERALAKQPDDRFASVSELAQALVPYGPTHASLRASRVSRLLPSVPRHSSRHSGVPMPSRTPNPKNRTPPDGSKSEPDKPPSMPRGPTPNDWEMSRTRVDGRTQARRVGVVALALLVPLGGFFGYRAFRAPEPAVSVSANVPAPPAPEVGAGKLEVAPEGPAAVAPTSDPTAETSAAPAPVEPEPAAAAAVPAPARPAAPAAVRPRAAAPARPAETPAKPAPSAAPKPLPAEPPGLSDFGGRR
jgi:serine/threonine-protein kinase